MRYPTWLMVLGGGVLALFSAVSCTKKSGQWVRPSPTPLTHEARFDGEPSLSPDGKRLVFSSFGDADLDLFVIDPEKPGERRLLYAGAGDDRQPAVNPGGDRVAFTQVTGSESDILVVDFEGGEARRLTVEAGADGQAAWNDAGDRLAFVSDRTGRSEVWVLTLSTGQATPISAVSPPAPDFVLMDPAWRGSEVLVSARVVIKAGIPGGSDSVMTDLWAIPGAGGPWVRLTSGPARERHPNPAPNGRLAFTSDTTGYANLYVREPDGQVTLITDERTDIHESCWMGGGSRLVYARTSPWALVARPLAGGTVDTVQAPWGRNLHPSWSPDATELAFHSDLDGQDDVWRVGVADGGAGPVTSSTQDDTDPDWSGSANRILFTGHRSGNADIWIMDPSGVEYFQLTHDPAPDREAGWSPDGTMVVFVSDRSGRTDLWWLSAAGGEPARITDDEARDSWPCFLADNRTIVFESDRGGERALWSVPIEGGQPHRLTTPAGTGAWDGRPAPVPNQPDAILFTRSLNGNSAIFRLNRIDGSVVSIMDDPGSLEDHPAASRDGSQVAWQSGGNLDLWSIDASRAPTDE